MAPRSILCTYHCQPSIKVIIITMCFGRCSEDEMSQSRPHINAQRKRQDNSNKQRVECRVMPTNVVFVHYIAHRLVQTRPLCWATPSRPSVCTTPDDLMRRLKKPEES